MKKSLARTHLAGIPNAPTRNIQCYLLLKLYPELSETTYSPFRSRESLGLRGDEYATFAILIVYVLGVTRLSLNTALLPPISSIA